MVQRVILHVGTPKTGTTALQQYFYDRQKWLTQHAVFYPQPRSTSNNHYYLKDVFYGGADAIVAAFDEIFDAAPKHTRTIFLSYEGLYSGWRKVPAAAREGLRRVAERYPLEVWVDFREPLDFLLSLHNHTARRYDEDAYQRTARGLEEMVARPKVGWECDYSSFVESMGAVISPSRLRVRPYSASIVRDVLRELGLPFDGNEHRLNSAVSVATIDTVVRLRHCDMPKAERKAEVRRLLAADDPVAGALVPTLPVLEAAARHRAAHGGLRTVDGRTLDECWGPPRYPLPTLPIEAVSEALVAAGTDFAADDDADAASTSRIRRYFGRFLRASNEDAAEQQALDADSGLVLPGGRDPLDRD